MAVARHARPKELESASLEEIMGRYVARYADRRADWAAFEDAKDRGFQACSASIYRRWWLRRTWRQFCDSSGKFHSFNHVRASWTGKRSTYA